MRRQGISEQGIYLYKEESYEIGDLILGKSQSGWALGLVTKDFPETHSLSFDDALSGYCSFYNEGSNKFISKGQVISEVEKLEKFYTINGNTNNISGDIWKVSSAGLYRILSTAQNLPAAYAAESLVISSHLYLRVTKDDAKNLFLEILDFDNVRYFVGMKSTTSKIDWIDSTGNDIAKATATISAQYSILMTRSTSLDKLIDEYTDRVWADKDITVSPADTDLVVFTESELEYLVNLSYQDSVNSVTFTRKFSIKVHKNDPVGTIYDEFGTTKNTATNVHIGSGLQVTSVYKIR